MARAVIVMDRGWIFAGDVVDAGGRITLTNAVWVYGFSSIGFGAVLANPKRAGADVRPLGSYTIDMPSGVELFRIPVVDGWGL